MKNKIIDTNSVNKESIMLFIDSRKRYLELRDKKRTNTEDMELKKLFDFIENFIVNVINKDNEYYRKLESYHIPKDDLIHCLF